MKGPPGSDSFATRASVFGATSAITGEPGRWRRVLWFGWIAVWLGFLVMPIGDLAGRGLGAGPTAAAFLALALSSALWLRVLWLALATAAPPRAIGRWLGCLAALDLLLGLGFGGSWVGLFIYLSIAFAVALPLRWVLPAVVAMTVLAVLRSWLGHEDVDTIGTRLFLVLFLGLMMGFYRRMMLLVIELREARVARARLAVNEERLRFARDLHDLLGHSLSTIALKTQLARRLLEHDASAAAREIDDVGAVTQQALVEVREAVTGYRQRSMSAELDTARSALASAGIDVRVQADGDALPSEADELLAWVVREGATNVLRHSHAQHCRISLRRTPGAARLEIHDDGAGSPDGRGPGSGLTGLAERLTAVGGRLEAGAAPGRGFSLTAHVPVVGSPGIAAAP
ncbi:sensor histidine kinase [Solihabitans fulvus]|uniref:Sensor histidine kinase n=1 Tax=Solihabitans fulvus TaxID=1892852 RepID=A0A5B2XHP7_9PSEU|nr:sensor histidine kinase [Solihabitans fulvus]KAA2262704.1 sensor histidine kinase [Solihabitans fulvus]